MYNFQKIHFFQFSSEVFFTLISLWFCRRMISCEIYPHTLKKIVSHVSYFATHCTTHRIATLGAPSDTFYPLILRHILRARFEPSLHHFYLFFPLGSGPLLFLSSFRIKNNVISYSHSSSTKRRDLGCLPPRDDLISIEPLRGSPISIVDFSMHSRTVSDLLI